MAHTLTRLQRLQHAFWRLEGPTWLVATAVYGGWFALTWYFHALPGWLVLPLGTLVIGWYINLQHEATHHHPVNVKVAEVLATAPLYFWLPFPLYRESHQAHHRADLTDPLDDPESYYLLLEKHWTRMPGWLRSAALVFYTLPGRMLLGPAVVISRFFWAEGRKLLAGDRHHWRIWALHTLWSAPVLYWIIGVCQIPFWQYLLLFVYPGTSIALVRSFYEHRYHEDPRSRTAVVEAGLLWRTLFLNNNLHIAHHERPDLPWYALPGHYREHRQRHLESSRDFHFRGYGELFRRYLFKPVYHPVHPRYKTD